MVSTNPAMPALNAFDYAALGWFFLCWFGFTVFADHSPMRVRSISNIMEEQRKRWMKNMVGRELRMIDTMIQGSLLTGVAFFASASLILVGGSMTVLGASDKAIAILHEFPIAEEVSRNVWQLKVMLLIVIFIYAFFKFAWCHRLFSYVSILMGAAPLETQGSVQGERYAERTASLHGLAALSFIHGLRAFFFALGAIAWFLGPLPFILAASWVTLILFFREFRSESHEILRSL